MNDIGALILAGGKCSRMGTEKALLTVSGQTFLKRMTKELSLFDEQLLSVDKAMRFKESSLHKVEDKFDAIGPIGGLYSALEECCSNWLLTVSCDMPMFSRELAEYMCAFIHDGYDAFLVVTRQGRIQPLCAVYSKAANKVLKAQIDAGNYRLRDAMKKLRVKYIPLKYSMFPDEAVQNINTPEEYQALIHHFDNSQNHFFAQSPSHHSNHYTNQPPIIAVCGVKNSGKTTLLVGIIAKLCQAGLRVAVIKHDGHDFDPDVPGTDSFRMRKAGAFAAAVYSGRRYMITEENAAFDIEEFCACVKDADIILLEGGKQTIYPKIEIVRSQISNTIVSNPKTLIVVCSDMDIQIPQVPVLSTDDFDGVTKILLNYIKGEHYE